MITRYVSFLIAHQAMSSFPPNFPSTMNPFSCTSIHRHLQSFIFITSNENFQPSRSYPELAIAKTSRVQLKGSSTGRFAQDHWLLRKAVTPSPVQSLICSSEVLNLHVSDPLTACDRCASRSRYTSMFLPEHAHRHHFGAHSVGTDLEWRAL